MAFALIEGFDLVGSSADLISKGFVTAEGAWGAGTGRFGGAGYTLSTNFSEVLSISQSFVRYNTLSFWFKTSVNTICNICGFSDLPAPVIGPQATTSHLYIDALADGSIRLFGDFTLRGTSATGVLIVDTWHHIEVQGDINNSGQGIVTVDGIEVLNVSADFADTTTDYSSPVFYGDAGGNVFDDIIYQNDVSALPAILGEHKIHTLLPSADTAQADWTGAFTDVDDPAGSSDGDTTFINATTLNDKSEFALGDLSESPTTVHAVQSVIEARKTDAGTIGVTHHIDSNGTEEAGTEFAAAETYGSHQAIHPLNPDGSVAWTETTVNALLVGVEITT
jgi:hypothetical protein